MSREVENEFKIMLDKSEYEKILAMYEFTSIVQTNHYFDTDDLEMSSRHTTVRVREIDGKCFLQVKFPTEVSFSRVEFCGEVDGVPKSISAERLKSLTGADMPDVRRLGALKTTRNIHRFDGGEIDLDCSEYFGVTDYELEIEFSNEQKARAVLDEIRASVPANGEVCSGKFHRFIDEFRRKRVDKFPRK